LDKNIPADVALEFGNAYSLRLLQGAAHYVYLMEATESDADSEAAFEVVKFGQGMDDDLKLRLLHGYWSFMRTCFQLHSTPPLDLTTCEALGIAEWHRSYYFPFNTPSPDLLELLQKIRHSLRAWCDQDFNLGWLRREKALSHLDREIRRVRDNIMDHFDHRG
jgi:hypothetical protein